MLRFNLLALAILAVLSYLSLLLKAEVQNIKEEYILINTKVSSEIETIKLLKAELTHLQSPKRIKALAQKYLKLEHTSTAQLIIDPTTSDENLSIKTTNFRTAHNNITWRYKKSPYTKHTNPVRRASHKPSN